MDASINALLTEIKKTIIGDREITERRKRWDNTLAGKQIRIRWDHFEMVIEELPGGKGKVKRKVRRMYINTSILTSSHYKQSSFLISNLVMDAKLRKSMTYDGAVKAVTKAFKMAADTAEAQSPAFSFSKLGGMGGFAREETRSHLTVEPGDYTPLEIRGDDYAITSEWTKFKATKWHGDPLDRPSYSQLSQKSPGSARKLFKYLKANPMALKKVSFGDLPAWLRRHKIAYTP